MEQTPPDVVAATGASQALERAITNDAPVMIWVTEPDGRCSYLNRRWYEFTGQRPEDALGIGWVDAVHPDDRAQSEAVFLAANERREPFRLEYRLRRHDGEYLWAMDFAAPRLGPDGEFLGYVGSVVDITERRRAEEARRESEARFRAVFAAIDDGYCLCEMVLDPGGTPVDYRFLEANPGFEVMTGLSGAVGHTALELVPDLEPHWVETYGRVALEGTPLRFEQGSHAMGRWFDVFATPVEPRGHFALVFSDVTVRKQAEEALLANAATERRARERAELLNVASVELERDAGAAAWANRLVDLLVPRLGDAATVRLPDEDGRLVAIAGAPQPDTSLGGAAGIVDPHLRRVDAPLDVGAARPGTLRITRSDPERAPFDDDDRALVAELAERAGAMFSRARLREHEHAVAVRLQRALLPDAVLSHPHVEVAARYEAGSALLEVGGDWHDAFALPDGRLVFAVGDVVGHGLDAAATMGRMRTAFAALAPHADSPGELLAHLDAFAAGPNGTDYATACVVILDPESGRLRQASAGHPPVLVLSSDARTHWLKDGRTGPLAAALRGVERTEASDVLAPGDMLVLYSDGLVERRREHFTKSLARLADAAQGAPRGTAGELCDRLLEDMGVAENRDDDVVVMCVRFTGPSAVASSPSG